MQTIKYVASSAQDSEILADNFLYADKKLRFFISLLVFFHRYLKIGM